MRRLVVLDDIFPVALSAFRIAEYNAYLDAFPDAEIRTTGTSFPVAGETRPVETVIADYERTFPRHAGRVAPLGPDVDLRGALAYTIFVNNAATFLPYLEQAGCPFVFTLYPGGGLQLFDRGSNQKLRRVFASPVFRRVITTQIVTQNYVVGRYCRPEQTRFVYGGVLPTDRLLGDPVPRRRPGVDKATFDVVFVANKYMPRGEDKGYDVFVDAAHRLAGRHPDARFHVVGGFTAADVDVSALGDRITFHGTLPTAAFPDLYAGMDVIVSPNRASHLAPGAFDGFPTGACIEAGLCGVVVVCTDPIGLNVALDDDELIVVDVDAAAIAERVSALHDDAGELARRSARTAAGFERVFSLERQMAPRLEVLREELAR